MLSKYSPKISNFSSYLHSWWNRMICKQSTKSICLTRNCFKISNNKIAIWKGLDKDNGKFTYLFCQGPCGPTPSARMAGPSLTMKTAPLLHRKVSKYTSQCDQSNITVMVCVIRISLYNKDRRFSGGSAKQRSVIVPIDLVANITRDHWSSIHQRNP
jgi:hypothetical protein